MTHQQARLFIIVMGVGMLVIGILMASIAHERRLREHGVKLGVVGGIFLSMAALH